MPEGQYGAHTVRIWDCGIYDFEDTEPSNLKFVSHGIKLNGSMHSYAQRSAPRISCSSNLRKVE
jgi:hypothetical protein